MPQSAIAASVWGTTRHPDPRKPKHKLDHGRSTREGYPIALCGEPLHYLDGDTRVHEGDVCSGRTMVAERNRECIRCLRRDAERISDLVLVPISVMHAVAVNAPAVWEMLTLQLDPQVVAVVNSYAFSQPA